MTAESMAISARRLLAGANQGLLASLSADLGGYPAACVIAFARDRMGRALFLLARGTQQMRSVTRDDRISLTVAGDADDMPVPESLTITGRAAPVPLAEQDDAARRLYRRFPQAEALHRSRDFELYRLEPVRARYSAGFGAERWVEAGALCDASPFPAAVEEDMVACMNCSHVDAMRGYCRLFAVEPGEHAPRLAAIDHAGFDLMIGRHLLRIDFERPVDSAEEVRRALVALTLQARETGLLAA
jgi:hypothetical protein